MPLLFCALNFFDWESSYEYFFSSFSINARALYAYVFPSYSSFLESTLPIYCTTLLLSAFFLYLSDNNNPASAERINGTSQNDNLTGTPNNDRISGSDGKIH